MAFGAAVRTTTPKISDVNGQESVVEYKITVKYRGAGDDFGASARGELHLRQLGGPRCGDS